MNSIKLSVFLFNVDGLPVASIAYTEFVCLGGVLELHCWIAGIMKLLEFV